MIKDLQVTLYEVFGYLIPGIVNLTGLAVLFLAMFLPSTEVILDLHTGELWVAFLLTAYVAGHMAQAIANTIERRLKPVEQTVIESTSSDRFPQSLVDACKAKAQELTAADLGSAAPRWLYRVCDDAVVRSGKIGEREIFVYREGFYRGMFISLIMMAVGCFALCVRLFFATGLRLRMDKAHWDVTRAQLVFFAMVAGTWSYLSYRRYRRFGEYRTTQALIGFLTVKEPKKETGSSEKKGE